MLRQGTLSLVIGSFARLIDDYVLDAYGYPSDFFVSPRPVLNIGKDYCSLQ